MNLESGVLQVHIEDIIPNRFQPRLSFDEQGLKELADSIREHGIIQPLVLRKLGDKYEIIAGERRYKAAQMVGLPTVPAVIANIDDNKSAEVALVENVQRRDLTAIEEARSYKSLLDKGYLTQDQLAKRMGLSQPAIANKLRLLNLDEEVQQALLEEKISERHARTLLSLSDKTAQRDWLHRIINERLTVRQLDLEIKKLKESNPSLYMDDEESGDVPLVSGTPSIEDIKANAMDLSEANRIRQEAPSPAPEPEVLDTLEEPQPTPAEPFPVQENFTTATTIPEFNIATPNSVSTFVPQANIVEPTNDSKYFSFNQSMAPEEPQSTPTFMTPSEMMNNMNNTNNMPPVEPDNNGFEVFDTLSPKPAFVDLGLNQPIAPPEPQPEINNIQMPANSPISPLTGALNTDFDRNPNNRFFTPVTETKPEITINGPQDEVVDPMKALDSVTPGTQGMMSSAPGKMDLKDAISTIRSCIEGLGDQGFFINVEEIDFDNNYQITMQIHKDN